MPTADKQNFFVEKGIELEGGFKLNNVTVTNLVDSAATTSILTDSTNAASIISAAGGSVVKGYDSSELLPLSNNTTGELNYVKETNRLYLWNGSGWYNIATVNTTPTMTTTPDSNYTMDSVGASLTITLVATDPEGLPITYSATSDSSSTFVTISQDSGVFTITPLTQAQLDTNGVSNGGTFSINFKASDGINIVPNVTNFTLSLAVPKVTNSGYTSALITAEGTSDNNNLTDASSNNNTITAYGDAGISAVSPYRHGGYSYYGSANAHHLYTTIGTLGLQPFTIECWVYWPTISGPEGVFEINTQVAPSSQTSTISVFTRSSTYSYNWAFATNGSQVNSSTAPTANTWHHVALVRDSNNLITLYIDGTSLITRTDATSISATTLTIGRYYNTSFNVNGYIHDFRIVKNTAVYTSNFTPPTEKLAAITNTDLLTCRLGVLRDESTNARTINVSYDGNDGSPRNYPFSPYDNATYVAADHGGSIKMSDSRSDTTHYFTVSDGDWKTYGTDDFTIEFWFRPGDDMSGRQFMFADFNSGGQNASSSIVLYYQSGLKSWIETSAATAQSINGGVARAHIWHHAAMVRNGTTMTMYLNGVSQGTYNVGSASINNSSEDMYIGKYQGGEAFEGFMSDIRVVKGTAVYTSNFTPPTAPLSTISGTSLHIKCTDASVVDKSQKHNLKLETNIGNGTIPTGSTTQVKFNGSKSIYFDGNNGYGIIDQNNFLVDQMDFGTDDYTVEFWMYPVLSGNCFVFGFSDSSGTDSSVAFALRINYSASNLTVRFQNCNDAGTLNLSLQHIGNYNNTWSHVAVTRTGGNQYMYINGSQVATQSEASAHMRTPATSFAVGRAGDRSAFYYKGYLQDLRITKGLARYTSSFTAPSAPFEG